MSSTEKAKVDWTLIEVDYRAGVKSLEQIGKEYGVTKGRISQVAKKYSWERDLKKKIQARAEAKLNREAVNAELNADRKRLAERDVVEANAELQYRIRMEHRQDIGRTRGLFQALLGEVETATREKNTFELVLDRIRKLTECESDETTKKMLFDSLADLQADISKLTSVHGRIDAAKKLTEILERVVRLEREAFGITDDEENKRTSVDDLLEALGS